MPNRARRRLITRAKIGHVESRLCLEGMEGGETGFDEIDDEGSYVTVGVQDHGHVILSRILADPSMVRFDQFGIHGGEMIGADRYPRSSESHAPSN